ncbi:hypothetical protein, partial [Streptomyces sp. NPDC059411]|uniref:hypothetical protein n=1 Tax=Streptomyces sp. NPDC059411 TaxID=3346825 RepID=UPI00367375F4
MTSTSPLDAGTYEVLRDRGAAPRRARGGGRPGRAGAPAPPRPGPARGRPRINRRDFATLDHGVPGTH